MDEATTNCYGIFRTADRSREAGGENPSARSCFVPIAPTAIARWEKDDLSRGHACMSGCANVTCES